MNWSFAPWRWNKSISPEQSDLVDSPQLHYIYPRATTKTVGEVVYVTYRVYYIHMRLQSTQVQTSWAGPC